MTWSPRTQISACATGGRMRPASSVTTEPMRCTASRSLVTALGADGKARYLSLGKSKRVSSGLVGSPEYLHH